LNPALSQQPPQATADAEIDAALLGPGLVQPDKLQEYRFEVGAESSVSTLAHSEHAAWLQHTQYLGCGRGWFIEVHEHRMCKSGIQGVVCEWKLVNAPDLKLKICQSSLCRQRLGASDRILVSIYPNDRAWCDELGQPDRDGTRPTAYIQDAHARPEVR
jgi:hypothetical protein